MQSEISAPRAVPISSATNQKAWTELWRGAWVIFRKHMRKFRGDSMEIGGTLGWPLLWIAIFGFGMERLVNPEMLGGGSGSYLAFITPGIIALTALSGAVNSGMTLLEEKIKGVIKEYLVAPIPRMSIMLASTLSGLTKTLLQSLIILAVAVILGAQLRLSLAGLIGTVLFLFLYVMGFVGFANGVAARSKSVGGYHMLLFVLNLPLLFLSNALYPLEIMPRWMQILAMLNPTTYVVDGLRHALFGAGSLPIALSAVVLIAFAALCNWYGVRSFRAIVEKQ